MKTYQKMRPAEIIADVRERGGTETLMMAAYGSDADRQQITALLLDAVAEERHGLTREKSRDESQGRLAIAVIYLTLFALYLFTTVLFSGVARNLPTLACFLAPAVFCHVMYSLSRSPWDTTGFQERAARSLADIAPDDHRTLGVLLDTLPMISASKVISFSPNAAGGMRRTFAAIAPILWKAGDDLPLTLAEARRKRLRGTLSALWYEEWDLSDEEADFCAAAIKALTLVGDTKSAKLLAQIAESSATTGNRIFIQSLAADCLLLLGEADRKTASDFKELEELLHPKGNKINTFAVDGLLGGFGEGRGNYLIQRYLQKHVAAKKQREHIATFAIVIVVLLLIAPIEARLFGVVVLVLLMGTQVPRLAEGLMQTSAGHNSGWEPSERSRLRVLGYHASKSKDPRLILPLFEAIDRSNFEYVGRFLAKQLRDLAPGDSVYSSPDLLFFLRAAVAEYSLGDEKSRYDAAFMEAAIYALGILQDKKAHCLLSRLSLSNDPRHTPFRGVLLDAIRRINHAKEWRESTK
ncbi:MAG: hypothetical protein H7145_01735 [Akkermansiaceae bacterium]|nr:hypothetical protein [Armatimonadota bacterium]